MISVNAAAPVTVVIYARNAAVTWPPVICSWPNGIRIAYMLAEAQNLTENSSIEYRCGGLLFRLEVFGVWPEALVLDPMLTPVAVYMVEAGSIGGGDGEATVIKAESGVFLASEGLWRFLRALVIG